MKHFFFAALLLLSGCGDKPHTRAPVVLAGSKDNREFNNARIAFQQNCASCHSPIKVATGPAFVEVMPGRSTGWLDTFFNYRRWFKSDSSYRSRVKEYGFSCPEIKSHLHQSHGCVRY